MWNFISPKVIFGEDSLDALEEISGRKALIITDANLVQLGIPELVESKLKKNGFSVQIFDEVDPDPSVDTVSRGVEVATEFEPDWFIGLGGGSPLDFAKAVWVIYERPDLLPAEINPFIELGLRKKARLVTIPTTSGTGSEVTWAFVLTDPVAKRKMGLGNRENIADLALVDPALASGMPPQLTADTGLDALTHAVESYLCTWHSDITDGLCLNAIHDIFRYLPYAYEASQSAQPDQAHFFQAREKMHNAATCAGLAFGNTNTSIAHAMGHVIGSVYNIPHGRAVGICLPYTIEFSGKEVSSRISKLSNFLDIENTGDNSGLVFAGAIRDLLKITETPSSLSELGIEEQAFEDQLEKLVGDAFNDTQIITAPRSPSYDDLQNIFRYVYAGQPIDF